MSAQTLFALYFALAFFVSFTCSLLEAVLLSISHAYVANRQKDHPASGKMLKKLKDRIDRPLAAILTLNTLAHTIGAAGVGAQALEIWNNNTSVAIASGILTFSILVGSEIIPKTLGAIYWRKLAPATGYTISGLIWILTPIVWLFENLSKLLTPKGKRVRMSRDEMMAVVQIGHTDGTLGPQETHIIYNMLHLQNIMAKDVLTPRSVLQAFQKDKTLAEAAKKHNPIRFSRIPVYDKSYDDIFGIVHRYKILQLLAEDKKDIKLEEIANPIHMIPETKSVASILDEFIKRREHIFLVVDEHGGTAGIITLEDAIETLLGVEIVDELDSVEDMRKLALQLWEKRKKQQKI